MMGEGVRRTLKSVADGAATAAVLPLLLLHASLSLCGRRDGVFWGFSQFLSLLPGLGGNYLRKAFYRGTMTRCSRECAILFGTLFSHRDTEIGRGVYIGPNCNIGCCAIADDCTLGSGVHILSGSRQHNFDDLNTPIREQGGIFEKVSIGEDTWIGNGAIVMADIGRKCIVGAGSVVAKPVEDCSVVAGNPARVIRRRDGQHSAESRNG